MEEKGEGGKKQRVIQVMISLLPEEKALLSNLAPVLYNRKYIKQPTNSNVVRYCCRAVAFFLAKEIEQERLGGQKEIER
jgi:hypothetical protein